MHTISQYPFLMALLFFASGGIPDRAKAVKNFDAKRYLGLWYEVARLDFYWERGLDNVTATYSLKPNGDIKVVNRGWDDKHAKWKQSIGKAKSVGDPSEARLKVSFFGPFYAGYNVIAIDKDYQYALVVGESTDYMWILSRTGQIPEAVKRDYLSQARAIGCDIDKLVWVKQDKQQ